MKELDVLVLHASQAIKRQAAPSHLGDRLLHAIKFGPGASLNEYGIAKEVHRLGVEHRLQV